jgi:hypothetical protein
MNSIDVFIARIVSGPTRVNTKTQCGFKVVVMVDTYGGLNKRILWYHNIKDAKDVKVGDSWSE